MWPWPILTIEGVNRSGRVPSALLFVGPNNIHRVDICMGQLAFCYLLFFVLVNTREEKICGVKWTQTWGQEPDISRDSLPCLYYSTASTSYLYMPCTIIWLGACFSWMWPTLCGRGFARKELSLPRDQRLHFWNCERYWEKSRMMNAKQCSQVW